MSDHEPTPETATDRAAAILADSFCDHLGRELRSRGGDVAHLSDAAKPMMQRVFVRALTAEARVRELEEEIRQLRLRAAALGQD